MEVLAKGGKLGGIGIVRWFYLFPPAALHSFFEKKRTV